MAPKATIACLIESGDVINGGHDQGGAVRGSALLIATAFCALFAIVGLCLYGLPFFYDFYVRDLGWTRAQVTTGNALGKIVIGPACGLLVGWIIDRAGPRLPMLGGVLLAGLALLGLASTTTLAAFYLFYAFNALAYVLAGPLPIQVLLSRHFGRRRGRAMGIAYLGIGLGGAVVPILASTLTNTFGWRGALRGLAAVVVLVALPLVLAMRPERGASASPSTARPRASLREILRQPAFYLLLVGSMASIGAVGGMSQHLKLLITLDLHGAQADAARTMSLVLAISLVGRLAAGWLADVFGPKRVMLVIYSFVTAAALLLALAPSRALSMLFPVVFGLGLGGEYLIIPLMAARLFGTAVLGRVMGIVLTADGLAEACVPVLVGRMRDVGGHYAPAFWMLVGIAVLGATAVALLPVDRLRVSAQDRQPQ